MKKQSQKDRNYKEFRCPQCNALQFKYKLDKDTFFVETKCYGCNHFSTLELNLGPLADVLNQLKKYEKGKKKKDKKKDN